MMSAALDLSSDIGIQPACAALQIRLGKEGRDVGVDRQCH